MFVENVVDKDDSLEDDEQNKKLTQSQRDFMDGAYHNEDDDFYDE